jgi:hypothetical protein
MAEIMSFLSILHNLINHNMAIMVFGLRVRLCLLEASYAIFHLK